MLKSLKYCLILSIISASSFCSGADISVQESKPPAKRVLAIFVFKQGMPWTFHLEQSLRTALAEKSDFSIELDIEHADQSRFPEEAYRAKIADLYRYKYSKQKIDLVLVMGEESVNLILQYGEELFAGIPVVLVSTDQKDLSPGLLKSNMISMVWGFDFAKTGSLIQDILPKTKNVFVISGTSPIDRKLKDLAVKTLGDLDVNYAVHYLDDLSLQDLLIKITQLPDNSVIFFLSLFRDVNGQSYVPRMLISELSEKANAPTFGIVDLYLGHGIVGGNLLSADYQGKKYAEIVAKILAGEQLSNFQFMKKDNQLIFDWRQLKRWSIDEDRLPSGSLIRYRESSIWADHQREVITVIIIIATLSFSLMALIIQHRRRRAAEQESQRLRNERAHISRVLAMGEIAASLAHELNQPLSAIRTYAQAAQRFLDKDPSEPDEAEKALAGILSGNRRAEEVITRIRMALKKESFEQLSLDVKDIIQDVILLTRKKAEEQNISLRVEITDGLPRVFGDRIQLQQVLFNLIINAIESMVDTRDTPHQIVIQVLREQTDAVMIAVKDSGIGIDEKKADSLFDAFYTTKANGMGMGLSISRSIIEDHGGQLCAALNPDKGTTFSFTIPVYKEDNK